jgi:hypothetical protein
MSEPVETPHAAGRRHALEALAQHCQGLLLARLEAAKAPGVLPEHREYLRGQADALDSVARRAKAG